MSYVRWEHRPQLRRPYLVAAFEGWNDAGEAASTAVRHLTEEWGAERFATLDPEDFYDFTVARPHVRLEGGFTRRIDWPTPTFTAARLPGSVHDVVLLSAIEPSLQWRTYCEDVLEVAAALGVERVFTLGALLADVPHTRPVRVSGTATDGHLIDELGFTRSRYEGPTGIVGVLHDAFATIGIPGASLWAATPHYLSQTPSPKAALALVEKVAQLLGTSVDTTALQIATTAYERQVDEMLAGEDDVVDYVRRLEEDAVDDADDDADEIEIPHPDALAAEVERFLRDQGR
ncbi:MAG TPA: PAC2 family protein [Acidimicrobiales bacterium]|nr:PAC2 family protein [Acidimicrobiales bacterium]